MASYLPEVSTSDHFLRPIFRPGSGSVCCGNPRNVYGPAEPVLVINNRRRLLGHRVDPYYTSTGAYSRGRLVPDVHLKAPIFTLGDIARIKDALAISGVYNVVCDIPLQSVVVSTRLSPHTIVSLVSQAVGEATLVTVVEPSDLVPTFIDRTRYSSYDDMYSYPSLTGSVYDPYYGRSYDNEFRPSRYYRYY